MAEFSIQSYLDRKRIESWLREGILWARTHQERFWTTVGTVVIAAIIVGFIIAHHETENEQAWTQLGVAQGLLLQNQNDAALKSLDQWFTRFANSQAADYAQFIKADTYYQQANYTQAAQTYGFLAATAHPTNLRPLALSAEISSEEMAGHIPQAQTLAQQFLDRYPDHFLTGTVYFTQARLAEMAGQPANASAIYDRFVLLYPQSPYTPVAQARIKALGGLSHPNTAPTPLSLPH